jgi:hypothetical protein
MFVGQKLSFPIENNEMLEENIACTKYKFMKRNVRFEYVYEIKCLENQHTNAKNQIIIKVC